MGEAIPIPRQLPGDAETRLRRLRSLAWLLDRSVGVGQKARFGLDPVVGLIPVVGDWVGAVLSLYIVYEALRLGLSWPVLGRMLLNIGVEAVAGAVPVLGDAFDFVWQANIRNLRLVEAHYHARLRPRSAASITGVLTVVGIALAVTLIVTLWLAIWLLKELIQLF
ncbi:MAG TPA: DUF4112 domain-containing protein [Opitutus sp.]|nr:DUF4112 domain-containing protein [Opitutus sp.]